MERIVWECLKTWRRSERLNIEGKGRSRKLHSEELRNLHSLSVSCKVKMSRRTEWEAVSNRREIQADVWLESMVERCNLVHSDEDVIRKLGNVCRTICRIRSVIREFSKSKASLLAFAMTWDDKCV